MIIQIFRELSWLKRFSLILIILIFVGCTSKKESNSKIYIDNATSKPCYGDKLVTGSIGDASNLIPILATDSASHEIADLIYNGLLKYDKNLNLIGDLAKDFTFSKDHLKIIFHLRKGVKWQDGYPFTADDVVFTYRLIMDPNTPTAYRSDYEFVKDVKKIDNYTVEVIYKRPFAPALSTWTVSILPKHLLEGKNILTSPLKSHPIGTGPFKFKRWDVGQKIELVANDNYFMGRPYLDGFIYRVIPDSATMFLELKAGKVDLMGLTPIQYKRQTNSEFFKRNYRKFCYPTFAYTYLGFNLKNPLFKDRRVRQAIAYAINKDEIINVVLLGLGVKATGPYRPDMWYYNPNVKRYPYNPVKAKKLLEKAGWKDTDGDGILDKDGRKFEFTILTNQGNLNRLKTAEIIQKRLGEIGIKVKIRVIEWAAFINDFINKRRFEAVILGWSTGIDPDQYDIWHSSKTAPGDLNFISYKNKEVDKLLEKGRLTFDKERRKAIYFKFQKILAEDQPYVFLYVPYSLVIVHKRFHNVKLAPAGIMYNIERWYVPKFEQRY